MGSSCVRQVSVEGMVEDEDLGGLGMNEIIDQLPNSPSTTITPDSSQPNNLSLTSSSIPSNDQNLSLKLFLFHFLSELHASGNMTYRTEKYIYLIGKNYGIHATATILFRRAIISFQELNSLNAMSSETYTIAIHSGWKYGNLLLLDQLCYEILQKNLKFPEATHQLEMICQNPWSYSWYTVMLAFGCSSFGATTLFFGGNWIDGCWSFCFGILTFFLDLLTSKLSGLSEISCFVTSFLISLIASLLDKYLYSNSLCLFGQIFGGVVWLLPGITITIGLLEIYSQMPMYGSARLIYGISLASQLGFGVILGNMCGGHTKQIPDSFINGCREPIDVTYGIILLPLIALSFGILISSAYRQIPGMIITCSTGFLTSYVTYILGVDPSAIPFIAAMVVTIIGRIYAFLDGNQRPFTYIMTGLLVLVPGGVGVRGMSDLWSGDSQLGMEVTFQMLLIAVSLSMGHFIALIPSQKWFLIKVQRTHHLQPPQLYESPPHTRTSSGTSILHHHQKLFGDTSIQFSVINPIAPSQRHRLESMDGGEG
jgi:uncharacterized membrane protein YjjP (DUF1212 family)